MIPDVSTKDLGDGYYQHTYTIQSYQLIQSITSPLALPPPEPEPGSQLMGQNLNQFQPYRLSQYVQVKDVMDQKGELVELAHVQNDKLIVNPHAIEIFNHYPNNQISFVGNYGRLNCGKSFWYDKILNLSQFDGHSYAANKSRQGIYFWSIPFTKGKLKFFLLDYVGFEGRDKLSREDEILLDLELLLAEKFVIVPEPEDEELTVLPLAYNHLLNSQQRFTDKGVAANKFSSYWPDQIYTLYRSTKAVRKEIDNIGTLFEVYNFSVIHDALGKGAHGGKKDLERSTVFIQDKEAPLNQKYVRMTSVVFQDIYEKMKGKSYRGTGFNGSNFSKILEQATMTINRSGWVRVDQIFKGVKKDVSEDTFEKSRALFKKEVQPLRDGNPKPVDELIAAFQKGNTAAFGYFDSVNIKKEEKEPLQRRLREDIDLMEQHILEDNKRKTNLHYTQLLVLPPNTDSEQAYSQLKRSYIEDKNSHRLDHGDTEPVAKNLKKMGLVGPVVMMSEEEMLIKYRIDQRKRELQYVQNQQNRNPENRGVSSQKARMAQTRDILESKTINLKRSINEDRQLMNMSPEQKKLILQQLRSRHAENQVLKTKLNIDPAKNLELSALKEKYQKQIIKNRQLKDGAISLQKSGISQRSISKSIVRDVPDQHIKKVSQY